MADLKFDIAQLQASGSRVLDVRRVLSNMVSEAETVATAVGHDGLAHEVRSFASRWSIARRRLEDELTVMHDALHAIVQTIEDLDEKMSKRADELALPLDGGGDHGTSR